jgi:hypothetical protein
MYRLSANRQGRAKRAAVVLPLAAFLLLAHADHEARLATVADSGPKHWLRILSLRSASKVKPSQLWG